MGVINESAASMAHLTFCPNDILFGPISNCRTFDFTLRFENSILSLLPNAIFLLIALSLFTHAIFFRRTRIQIATERSACVPYRHGGILFLAGLHLALMIGALGLAPHLLPGVATSVGFDTLVMPGFALETFSALIITCSLTFRRSDRAAPMESLINTFLLFSSLFAAVQLRSFYFVPAARTSAFLPVLAADFGVRWLLFLTTSTQPKRLDPRQTSEERASYASRLLFLYLLPNLWKGVKQPIELNDLEPLAASYSSRVLEAKLFRAWHTSAGDSANCSLLGHDSSNLKEVKSHDMKEPISLSDPALHRTTPARLYTFLPKNSARRPRLVHASIRAFAGVLISPLPSKALNTLLILVQPLLVQEILDFIASYSKSSTKPQPAAHGYGLVGAVALVYLLIAVSSGHFTFSIYKTACKLRGALVDAVYRKTLVLSIDALLDTDTPSPQVMQSVDIERIVGGLSPFHEIWSAVVIIIAALYLLWRQIGISFLATIICLATLFSSIPLMTKHTSTHQKQWSKLTDRRTNLIAAAIKAISAVKLLAMERFLITKITSIRQREVKALIKYVQDLLYIKLVGNVAGDMLLLATITTFALVSAYHHHHNSAFPFKTSTVFTTITIIRIIERPLFVIGRRYASVISAVTSLKRLETFLLLPEQVSTDTTHLSFNKNSHLAAQAAAVFVNASLARKPLSAYTDKGDGDASAPMQSNEPQQGDGPILRALNLVLPSNAMIVVVGEVGVGKTSFLTALLGELPLLQGEMLLPIRAAPIAYVSQNPWILCEKSVKDNILFYQSFDEDRYQRALAACGLLLDVQQMPKGDLTLGKHLSGGQKQRVALCRAIYSESQTYILDDILSAVDSSTALSINQALFSRQNGLLRGKTVIMTTNSVQQMHLADHIVQIRSGGTVDMLTSEAVTVSKLADDIGVLRRGAAEHRGSNEVTNGDSSSAALVRNAVAKEPGDPESEDEHEEVLIGRIKLSVFKRYFRAAGWCALWYPLAVVMQTGFANGQLLWLQAWAKNVSEDTLPGSIGMHIGILVLLVLGRFVTYAGSLLIYLLLFCPKISLQLHHDLLNGVLLSGADFFLNLNPGRMINRFTQDVFALDFQICTYVVNVALFVINLGYSLVLMMLPAPYLVGVIVAMAALYFLIYRLYSPSSRQLRRLEMATKSSLHSQFRETGDVQGLLTIRASQLGLHFSRTTAFLLDMSQRPYYSLWAVRVWLQTWLNMLAMVLNTGLVLFAVSLRHTSSSGLVAVALVQAISLSSDLNGLMSAWTDLEIGVVSLERIEQVITLPADPKDTPARFQEMPSTVKGNTTPAAVAVRFEDVTAGYQGRDGPMSLHKVSFDLKPGERLGICGRSGSGKSTLVLSLLRILEPASGRITIDGVDISTYTGSSVRQGISYVPQEPIVLPSLTVRENLDPDCEQSDDQAFWKVLGQTAMSETVSQLPEGLDSPVDLQSLSMGQKQLLNVARALLKRRGLWVLDEATSSLDLETDAQIQLALAGATLDDKGDYGNKVPRAQSKKRAGVICNDRDSTFDATLPGPSRPTLITVAHRLSTIMDYDKILVLGGAKVLEFGSPSELLQLENGEFKTMVEEQNRSIR